MNKRDFLKQRRPAWKRFEWLLGQIDRLSKRKLKADQLAEFSRLLRELSNDLAVIHSRDWGRGLSVYLNGLVARGHSAFYTAPPSDLSDVIRFLAFGFPRLLRKNVYYFLLSSILFYVPAAISWAVIQNEPSLADRVIPVDVLDMFESMYDSSLPESKTSDQPGTAAEVPSTPVDSQDRGRDPDTRSGRHWMQGFDEQRAAMAGFYVYNNVGIALSCFARGILLGIGTVYTLLYNGISIGALGGFVVSHGHAERFVSFVISHGSFELTAICISGAAGLMLGDALLHPGQRTRIESLRNRGLEAVKIAAGAAVMLAIAALIEAFWSPSAASALVKYMVGTFLWILVILYFIFAGRQPMRS